MSRPLAQAGTDAWARRWGWLLVPAVVLVVYWPLSTFTYGLTTGDTLDCWMPWRWHIAQALQDGHFPLWDPCQQMGYPIYADLQGPSWYLEAIALGGTVGHSVYTLQALYLAYLIIGGWGFLRLVRVMHADARVAVIAGVAYALGGFFTAHQMHFYAIISGAWLPWLLAAQIKLLQKPGWRPALEAAVFQFFGLTGGNHTFNILGAYLLLALTVVHGVRALRNGDRAYAKRLLGGQALFALATVLMACGTLYAWWEVRPHLSRAEGMAYADAASQPFTWRAASSWLLPYAVGTDAKRLGTDAAMANGYIGVLMMLFAALALLRRRSLVENTLLVFGLVCALASFGAALPVHRWLWSVLPGLDLFRFPSYYQWFLALAVLVLAAGTLKQWNDVAAAWPRTVRTVIIAGLLLFAGLIVRAWVDPGAGSSPEDGHGLAVYLTSLGRPHRVLIEAPVTLLALIGLLLWTLRGRGRWSTVLGLVVLEMGWNTTLAQWNTANADHAPAMLQGRIDELPRGPVWPGLWPIGRNTDGSRTLKYIWRNVQDFQGRPTHDGFNSFWLKEANALEMDNAALWQAMKRQPLVYLSDSVVTADRYAPDRVDPTRDSALVVLAAGQAPLGPLRHDPSDRVEVIGADHGHIAVATHTAAACFLMLQQCAYPGWHVSIDGRAAELLRANIATFGVRLPAGAHRVEFRFTKPVVPWLLAVSWLAFLAAGGAVVFTMAAGGLRTMIIALFLLLNAMMAWSLFGHRPKAERIQAALLEWVPHLRDDRLVLNTDRPPAVAPLLQEHEYRVVRADDAAQVELALKEAIGPGPCWWADIGLPTAPAVRAALLDRYRIDRTERAGELEAVHLVPMEDTTVFGPSLFRLHPPHGQLLAGGSPYTPAYRVPASDLLARKPGSLVVDVAYTCTRHPKAYVVIERKRGETTTDYETQPIEPTASGAGAVHYTYVVRDLRELRHPDEEVGIYVWNDSPDTLVVHDLRVRVTARDLAHW